MFGKIPLPQPQFVIVTFRPFQCVFLLRQPAFQKMPQDDLSILVVYFELLNVEAKSHRIHV